MGNVYEVSLYNPVHISEGHEVHLIFNDWEFKTDGFILSLISDSFFELVKSNDEDNPSGNKVFQIDLSKENTGFKNLSKNGLNHFFKFITGNTLTLDDDGVADFKQICENLCLPKINYFFERSIKRNKPKRTKHNANKGQKQAFYAIIQKNYPEFLEKSKKFESGPAREILKELEIEVFIINESSEPPEIYLKIAEGGKIDNYDFDTKYDRNTELFPVCLSASINNEELTKKLTRDYDEDQIISAMRCAAIYDCLKTFTLLYGLLEQQIDDEDEIQEIFNERNIIMCAILGASIDIVEYICSLITFDPDYQIDSGRTFLHYASMIIFEDKINDYFKIIHDYILKVKSDLIVFDNTGKCPIQYMVEKMKEFTNTKILKFEENKSAQFISRRSQNIKSNSKKFQNYVVKTLEKYYEDRNIVGFKNLLNFSALAYDVKFSGVEGERPFLNILVLKPDSQEYIKCFYEAMIEQSNPKSPKYNLLCRNPQNEYNALFEACTVENNEKNIEAVLDCGLVGDLFTRFEVSLPSTDKTQTSFRRGNENIFTFLTKARIFGYLRFILKYCKDRNIRMDEAKECTIINDHEEIDKIFNDEFSYPFILSPSHYQRKSNIIIEEEEDPNEPTLQRSNYIAEAPVKMKKYSKVSQKSSDASKVSPKSSDASRISPKSSDALRNSPKSSNASKSSVQTGNAKFPDPFANLYKKTSAIAETQVKDPDYPINAVNKDNDTPAIMAAKNNLDKVITVLIDKGCNLDHVGKNNHTAASAAVAANHENMLKYIIKRWIPGSVDLLKKLIFECACRDSRNFIKPVFDQYKNEPVFLELKRSNFVVTADGNTALHVASQKGRTDIVKFLLENGMNVDCRGNNNMVPLMYAIQSSKQETVKVLLENGANVELKDENQKTPLIYAIESKNMNSINPLLERGANPNNGVETKEGVRSAFIFAVLNRQPEIVRALLNSSKKVDLTQIYNGMKPIQHAQCLERQFEKDVIKSKLCAEMINEIQKFS